MRGSPVLGLRAGPDGALWWRALRPEPAPLASPSSVSPSASDGTIRVLVVDDHPLFCDALSMTLKVVAGLEKLDDGLLQMTQGVRWRETMEQLRAIHPEVRAIVSSGYSDDAVMSRYMDFGFKAVLPKPYDPAELVALVSEVLMD